MESKVFKLNRFCILASDGVWEFMSSREVVNWIGRLRDKYSAQLVAEMLVEEAVKRWRKEDYVVDDVTAIVLWLDYSVEMTNPTVTESGIAESRNLTNEKSSTAEDSDAFGRSFKYLWKIFSADQNKDEVYSVG
jgi:serine/threonine protein phosphatase PrpC